MGNEPSVQSGAIKPDKLYSIAEAVELLRGQNVSVTPETVKRYCRTKKVAGTRVGPRGAWMVKGKSLLVLRTEWGLDDLEN